MVFDDRASILNYFHKHGILISPQALDMILEKSLGQMLSNLITDDVTSSGYIDEKAVRGIMRGEIKQEKNDFEIYLPDIKVNSSVEDFRNVFVSRYKKLSKIISTSSSMRGTTDIKTAKKANGEIKIVGMVSEVEKTKNGHKKLILEDLEDSVNVILMKNKGLASELILQDEVIGVIGNPGKGSGDPVFFANEIIRPDIPMRVIDESKKEPVFVGSMSDIHVGSKTFRKDEFKKMISWLTGSDEVAQNLKYLILSGDVVDGIGVYPGQEEDLEILNPLEQYEQLGEYLSEIPEDIRVFVMPGNHDSVRLAEPQPVFSEKIKNSLGRNITLLPNPYTLTLEKRNVLVYHGMSLNDMVELVPGANYESIGKAIEEILKRRHLAPRYGGKTPIIPSNEDYHVIEKVPDIFITGHIHSHSLGNYRGVRYVNSSTWQSQTDYQKMMNFAPNPSILTLFDLNSKTTILKDFKI